MKDDQVSITLRVKLDRKAMKKLREISDEYQGSGQDEVPEVAPRTPTEIELARLYAYLHQMASIVPAKPYTLQSVGHALAEIRALAGNAQKARWHLLSGDPEVDVDPFWANKACRITLLTKAQVVDAFNALGIQEIPWWDEDPTVPEQCMVVIMPMKHKIEQ